MRSFVLFTIGATRWPAFATIALLKFGALYPAVGITNLPFDCGSFLTPAKSARTLWAYSALSICARCSLSE